MIYCLAKGLYELLCFFFLFSFWKPYSELSWNYFWAFYWMSLILYLDSCIIFHIYISCFFVMMILRMSFWGKRLTFKYRGYLFLWHYLKLFLIFLGSPVYRPYLLPTVLLTIPATATDLLAMFNCLSSNLPSIPIVTRSPHRRFHGWPSSFHGRPSFICFAYKIFMSSFPFTTTRFRFFWCFFFSVLSYTPISLQKRREKPLLSQFQRPHLPLSRSSLPQGPSKSMTLSATNSRWSTDVLLADPRCPQVLFHLYTFLFGAFLVPLWRSVQEAVRLFYSNLFFPIVPEGIEPMLRSHLLDVPIELSFSSNCVYLSALADFLQCPKTNFKVF